MFHWYQMNSEVFLDNTVLSVQQTCLSSIKTSCCKGIGITKVCGKDSVSFECLLFQVAKV